MINELSFERLRRECDPRLMRCETTEDLTPLEGIIGQERAVRALRFGLDIKERGFNIYVAGLPGTGRTTAVKDFLEEIAKTKPVPSDWCYVNNFRNSYEPKAIQLPPGKGKELQKDMKDFVDEARRELPKAFESEDYATKREATVRSIEEERRKLFAQLNERAQEEGFFLQSTPMGLLIIPVMEGRPLSDEELIALSPQMKEGIQKRRDKLGAELRSHEAVEGLREKGQRGASKTESGSRSLHHRAFSFRPN